MLNFELQMDSKLPERTVKRQLDYKLAKPSIGPQRKHTYLALPIFTEHLNSSQRLLWTGVAKDDNSTQDAVRL